MTQDEVTNSRYALLHLFNKFLAFRTSNHAQMNTAESLSNTYIRHAKDAVILTASTHLNRIAYLCAKNLLFNRLPASSKPIARLCFMVSS